MNRNFISTFCCALLCSVIFCAASQAQTKKLSIVKAQTPLLQGTHGGVVLSAQDFEVADACHTNYSKLWILLDADKKVLVSNNQTMCGSWLPMMFTFENQQLGQKFYFRYKAIDSCGVMDSIEYLLEPKKEMLSNLFCYEGLSVDLMPNTGDVWLSAEQFFRGEYKGINNPMLRIERGYPFGTTAPTTEMINVSCVGIFPIRIWAKYPNGDWSSCDTYVDIQNNMGATPKGIDCPPVRGCFIGAHSIRGSVTTLNGKAIDNAIINAEMVANINLKVKEGRYNLLVAPAANVKFHIVKDDDPLNGISLFDAVLVNRHLLGTQTISDKYALIAADVNNSGKISTADIVLLRKMILGLQKDFTNNQSWRFFSKGMNETIVINNVKRDTVIDFTAVKIGDINGNANAASAPRAAKTHIFELENKDLAEGDTYTLSLKGIDGFAFTLRYDAENLELIHLDENSALLENGLITTAQINSEFKATFRAKSNITLSNAIHLTSDITHAEAIVAGELQDIALQFSESATAFELFQNQPNPFQDVTKISFILPSASQAKITISDVTGRVLKTLENDFPKGYNEFIINDLQEFGVLYYTIETPTHRATKKMLKVK